MFAFLLRFWIEMSLEIGLCAMIEIAMKETGSAKELASFYTSIIVLFGTIFAIFHLRKMLRVKFYKINHSGYPLFNMYYEELWDNLKLCKERPPVFNLVFMMRRLFYSAIIVIPCLFEIPAIF